MLAELLVVPLEPANRSPQLFMDIMADKTQRNAWKLQLLSVKFLLLTHQLVKLLFLVGQNHIIPSGGFSIRRTEVRQENFFRKTAYSV